MTQMRPFDPALYPAAVALVTAALNDDEDSFEAIFAEVGAEVVRPLADLSAGLARLLADASGEPLTTVLARVGMFGALLADES